MLHAISILLAFLLIRFNYQVVSEIMVNSSRNSDYNCVSIGIGTILGLICSWVLFVSTPNSTIKSIAFYIFTFSVLTITNINCVWANPESSIKLHV